jgi:hypothetical protein
MTKKTMKMSRGGNLIVRSLSFDDVSWQQANEMAKEDGLNLSAMVRLLVRQQYRKRKTVEQGVPV